jgi:hypothetical protein
VVGLPEKDRILIGRVEYVRVIGHHGETRVKGKIDTGASRTSVDVRLAAKIGLGPTVDVTKVKSALASQVRTRPLVRCVVEVGGIRFGLPVTVNDRSVMRYPVLIGMDILRSGRFLIDPTKKASRHRGSSRTTGQG